MYQSKTLYNTIYYLIKIITTCEDLKLNKIKS